MYTNMKRTEIARIFADMDQYGGQDVTVCGWARTIRDMKTFGFIELNDGSCFKNLQVVLEAGALDNYKEIAKQNVGAALDRHRHGGAHPRGQAAPGGEGRRHRRWRAPPPPTIPLQKKRHSVEFLRTIAASAPPHQPVLRRLPGAQRGGLRHPQLLPGPGLRLRPHPHHHRLATARARARCSA